MSAAAGAWTPPALAWRARLSWLAGAWAALALASPGVLSRDGAPLLALAGIALWAHAASRPGRRAFLAEWLAGGLGSAALCVWSWYVWGGTLVFLVLVPGLYAALAGLLLRRLARVLPLSLAAPAAWLPLELARFLLEPPFGYGWMRLGTYLHAVPWLAGSARVWGVFGLSLVLAALGGGAADLARPRAHDGARDGARERGRGGARERGRGGARERGRASGAALGLVPLALALGLSLATRAPRTAPGPRVLLVQPAFEQRRKMEPLNAEDLFAESCQLTVAGLREGRARGDPEPDLVAWGETMLPVPYMEEGLAQAWRRGARSPAWTRDEIDADLIARARALEARWVGDVLLGAGALEPIVPAGASFLAGCEAYLARGAEIRRANAVAQWNARRERAGLGGKQHLVPGGEALAGAERIGWVRGAAHAIAGYIPDLVAFDETGVLTLAARDGRASWRYGVSVCFDNAFDDPYTEPLRRGALDFHLVCSNEAWYLDSFEMDQMVAFSRLIAIQTARSIVRATNAGVSLVLDPEGREVARLVSAGKDRLVAGTLSATVPVPAAEGRPTPYVALEPAWLVLWALGPAALLAWALARERRRTRAPGAAVTARGYRMNGPS